jgi:glycosyltransferase involved in cell wall biosynthesis
MSGFNGVSVIIPCYNEVDSIAGTLEQVRAVLDTLGLPGEIIVVDDGSTDGTAAQVDLNRFRLVSNGVNLGYGAALMNGARAARYDCLVITDADGTYPIGEIPALVAQLEESDMVVGARTGPNVRIPWVRRPAKWLITRLANYVTGSRIPDLNSGLRAIRRGLWERFEGIFPKGFSLTSTITLAALTSGYRVIYHPIDYHARVGQSKIKPIRDTINFIMLILRTTLLFDPLRVFIPLSLLMILASVVIGGGSLIMKMINPEHLFLDTTTTLLFISGIQLLAMGGIADVIIRSNHHKK